MIERVIMPFDLAYPLPKSDFMWVPKSEADYVANLHFILESSCGYIMQSKIKIHHQTWSKTVWDTGFDYKQSEPYNLPLKLQRRTWDKATVKHILLDCVQTHYNYMPGNVFPATLTKLQRSIEVATSGVTIIIEKEGTTVHRMTKSIS